MAVKYQDGIAILQLIVYIPCLFLAVFLTFRHGLRKSSSWYFIAIFTLIRITGACCLLATISRPHSRGLYTAAIICSAIGLSPLILTCVALLSRANRSSRCNTGGINPSPCTHILNSRLFHLLTTFTFIALILCIVGGVLSGDSTKTLGTIKAPTKAGVIIFIIAWFGLCGLLIILATQSACIEKGEHRIILAVAMCIPFILVRLIYSIILSFAHDRHFNLISGSTTINLVMAVLEEFVVIILCLGVGLTLRVQKVTDVCARGVGLEHNTDKGEVVNEGGVESKARNPERAWHGGPITWVVRQAFARFAARRPP